MRLPIRSEGQGLFRLQKHDEHGNKVFDSGWFDNLILNQGIQKLMSEGNYNNPTYSYLRLGSGNSTPNIGQAGLDNQTHVTPSIGGAGHVSGYNADGGYQFRRYTYQFGQGVAAGNHAEIGAGWGTGVSQVFSRALIVDGMGNPTTLSVLANEFLTISYELRRWWIAPEPFDVEYDNDGTPTTTTVTPNTAYTNQELSVPGAPFICALNLGSITQIARDNTQAASGKTSLTFSWGLEQGNPQIDSISTTVNSTDRGRIFTPAGLLFTFSPPIPKTNEFIVNITIDLFFSRR